MEPGPLVEVEWVDSASTGGWQTKEDALSADLQAVAVGYLIRDDDSGVTLAQGADTYGGVLGTLTIPKAAVHAVHRLERSNE